MKNGISGPGAALANIWLWFAFPLRALARPPFLLSANARQRARLAMDGPGRHHNFRAGKIEGRRKKQGG